MEIINKITFDMAAAGMPPYIDAVQGDTLTRKVEITLMKRGQVFDPSDGFVSVSVAFKKPDGTSGWYDTLPNGNIAATVISDGVYQVSLAPEMFTVPGSVYALFRFDLDGKTISTFPFVVRVAENPSFNSAKSENYYNVQTWDAVNASFDEVFDKLEKLEQNGGSVDGAVLYTEQTLTPEQKAQARENIGAAGIGEGGMVDAGAVLYTEQTLTESQQAQARKNIGIDDDVITQMQKDISDLKYFPIDITNITDGKTVEMGSVVNDVTISWTLNKEPASQTVDGEPVDVSARSKAFNGLAISENKTFTLAVTDERGATDSASASVTFLNGVYYGVLEQGAEVNSAAILTLTRKLQGAKGITFTANAEETQQIVYALPTRYGTPGFNVGGFDGGFAKAKTFDFKNASGYTESYDVWLSENVGLGSTTVKVS